MKLVLKIMLGVVLAAVLLSAGCAVLVGGAASEAVDQIEEESNAHAITPAQYRSINHGMTRAQVESRLGIPSDDQEQNVEVMGSNYNSQCIYYNKPGEIASLYQFCFDNGRLNSKASY